MVFLSFLRGNKFAGHVIDIADLLVALAVPSVGVDSNLNIGATLAGLGPIIYTDLGVPVDVGGDFLGSVDSLSEGPGGAESSAHADVIGAADVPGIRHDLVHVVLFHLVYLLGCSSCSL